MTCLTVFISLSLDLEGLTSLSEANLPVFDTIQGTSKFAGSEFVRLGSIVKMLIAESVNFVCLVTRGG